MHNVHSQRAGSENAADKVLVSLVVEMSESESLSLAFQHFFLRHLAGALLRLLWSNSCVCFFVAKTQHYLVTLTWRWHTLFPRPRFLIIFPLRNDVIQEGPI